MNIKKIEENEIKKALELVWKVFLEYEAPDYSNEGIEEFKKSIDSRDFINQLEFYGAFEDEKIVGIIATRNVTHIALFFVDGNYHKKGIGKSLYEKVCSLNDKGFFTVNSSPYAKEVYRHLGFESTDEEKCVNGLRFIPMRCNI